MRVFLLCKGQVVKTNYKKGGKFMTKKFMILFGVIAVLALPSSAFAATAYNNDTDGTDGVDVQSVNQDSNLNLDVLAAIEITDVADDSDSAAPVEGGATNAQVTFTQSAELRSNLAWAVNSEVTADFTGGASGVAEPLGEAVVGDGASVDAGDRNADNSAQAVSADYTQDVSWGDEAGSYTADITHTAAQSLPAGP